MITLNPELVDLIWHPERERIRGGFDQLHGREPALKCIGAYLRFEGKGQLLPQLSKLLVHTDLLTTLQNRHKGGH